MMAKTTDTDLHDLVPHPRFGVKPRPSGTDISPDVVRASYCGYQTLAIFPETAIPADTTRQNFTVFPRRYYVDALKYCRDCDRRFIFFAEEQRYWYEELGISVDADCVRCPKCRKTHQELRRRLKRYSRHVAQDKLSDEALVFLVEDAVFLWNNGILKKQQKLRRIRNLARSRIPDHQVVQHIDALVDSLPPDGAG